MTGRMERVENLGEQRRGFASQRQVFHASHRPLEIAGAIPTFPQPDDDDTLLQTYKQQNQGDTSTEPAEGIFLLGVVNSKLHLARKFLKCYISSESATGHPHGLPALPVATFWG